MRRVVLTTLIVLGILVVAAGIGFAGFRMGMGYGIAQSPQVAEALQNLPEGSQVMPMMPGGFGPGYSYGMRGNFGWGPHMGWGMGGFGFLQCLVPLFFLFLIFGLFRLIFRPWGWHGRHWGWHGGPGMWDKEGVPPPFEEWHKRAHGQPTDTPTTPPTTP